MCTGVCTRCAPGVQSYVTKIDFLIFELELKSDHYSDLKFYEESEFDIFEAQGPSRDPIKRSRDQKLIF